MSGESVPDISAAEIRRIVRSEVSGLSREVDRRVRDLEGTLPSALHDLRRKQEALEHAVSNLQRTIDRQNVVAAARHDLGEARYQLQARFGRYEDAREMAASIIDVVASRHINRDVILDVTQRLAIQTPRYWVAQAALAVTWWLDDNPRQHREALAHALALDYEKTSLFIALVLRDQGRDEFLQEWLAAYLSRLTPENLPSHFQVVIDAATGNAFGNGAAPRLLRQLGDWYAEDESREDVYDTSVAEWRQRLLGLGARYGAQDPYPLLSANEQAWRVLGPRHRAAQAVEQAAGYFRDRFEAGAKVSDDVRADLVTLLGDLARTEDREEAEIRSSIRHNQAVVQANGDIDAANAMVTADEAGRNQLLNITATIRKSAFPAPEGGQLPAPTVTELLSIALNKALIAAAAQELRDDLEAAGTVEFTAGQRRWPYQFVYDDPERLTGEALKLQAEEQRRKICAQIDKDARRRQGRLQWLKKWGCPGGLATAIGLGGATFIPTAPHELIVPAVIVGLPSLLGIGRLSGVVTRARDRTRTEQESVSREIHGVAGQLAALWEARRSATVHLPRLTGYLAGLSEDSVRDAIVPLAAIPLPKTREFPAWTPRPPQQHLAIEGDDDPPPLPLG